MLLDTHVWLWQWLEPERITTAVAAALDEHEAHLSPASVWETLILARKGRVALRPTPREFIVDAIRSSPLTSLSISVPIALRSESLDGFASKDPADCFIVATALEHNLTLVTADAAMLAYEPLDTLAA